VDIFRTNVTIAQPTTREFQRHASLCHSDALLPIPCQRH